MATFITHLSIAVTIFLCLLYSFPISSANAINPSPDSPSFKLMQNACKNETAENLQLCLDTGKLIIQNATSNKPDDNNMNLAMSALKLAMEHQWNCSYNIAHIERKRKGTDNALEEDFSAEFSLAARQIADDEQAALRFLSQSTTKDASFSTRSAMDQVNGWILMLSNTGITNKNALHNVYGAKFALLIALEALKGHTN